MVVDVRNLTKTYNIYTKPIDRLRETFNPFGKKYHAIINSLQNVTFSASKGDIVGIIGKNGSGKSTLLKILAGVLTLTSGEIKIKGRISSILELGTGFNPEFTGIENIYHVGLISGYSKEEMDRKIQCIKDFADIGDFINQRVKIYSSGMYIRLAFAVAINVEPEILLIDEALAVGDMNFQAKCMSKFKQLVEKGVTVLLVTHDTNTVKSLCNSCLYLKSGSVEYFGEAKVAVDKYLFDMRLEMNKELMGQQNENTIVFKPIEICDSNDSNKPIFIKNDQFEKKMALFRHGSGEARIVNVQILDFSGNLINAIGFNERVIIRCHILFNSPAEIAVCYHIRDNKNIELIGSDSYVENYGTINGMKNEKIIVDFVTNLPLQEGYYNLLVLLSIPVLSNKNAIFVDWVENAYVFQVLQRQPYKIWDKVYVENNLKVYRINN